MEQDSSYMIMKAIKNETTAPSEHDSDLMYSELSFAAGAPTSEIPRRDEPETTYAQISPQKNQDPEVTPDKDQSRQEPAGGRNSDDTRCLRLVALIVIICLFAIIIGIGVFGFLSNRMLDMCQNDQAIERQRAGLLNRTLAGSMWNQSMLEGKFQNLSAAFALTSERANSLCNTFHKLSGSLCLRDWNVQDQTCYKFSTVQRDWNNSKQECESQNAHLAIINTPEKQNLLNELIKTKNENYWIGLTDRTEEGKWKWVNGITVSSLNWQKGQPDNFQNNENCALIGEDYRDQTVGWNDANCGTGHLFICEKSALPHIIAAADFEKFCS
ncbi:C-type lectin domain family 4 member E-like [Scyliorhinus torazame]|uniref:C-type lectin domain family 4 member E-like n=1 Tax=Scyliorhinus torazame TaxID=75743 RepID=UPI003B5A4973